MKIEGSTAVVTGGASGLGRATAERLIAHGGRVVILDLARSAGAEVAKGLGPRAVFAPADVTNPDEVAAGLAQTVDRFGGPHAVVNCAGVAIAEKTFGKRGPADLGAFTLVIQVNLIGSYNVIRLAAARMAQNTPNEDGERGVIVNTASVAAFDGQIGQAAYSASKGGIVGMTLPIARDLAEVGIRVCTIAPGLFETPMGAGTPPEVKARLIETLEFPKRLGDPAEFASLVAHLIENAYLNGEVIRLDAGTRAPPR